MATFTPADFAGVRTKPASQDTAPQPTAARRSSGAAFSPSDFAGRPGVGVDIPDIGEILSGSGEFAGEMVKEMVEGAAAPVVAATNLTKAFLADPHIGLLDSSDQAGYFQEAGKQGVKGAAFWGSAFAGGKVAGLALKPLWKAVSSGAAGAGLFQTINDLPDYITGDIKSEEYFPNIATAATLGAVTGGVLRTVPGATKGVIKAGNIAIDRIPGAANVRSKVMEHMRTMYSTVSNRFFTSGYETLKRFNLGEVAEGLKAARGSGALLGGRLVGGFHWNTRKLTQPERELMGSLLDTVDFRMDTKAGTGLLLKEFEHRWAEFAPDMAREQFEAVWGAARNEAKRLRFIGQLMQKMGLSTYDPINNEYHMFVLRDSYLPHRFNNPALYRGGGVYREESIRRIMKAKPDWTRERAVDWLDKFANRLEAKIEGIIDPSVSGASPGITGGSTFLRGRSFNLPGFENDVSKILPQYYEFAARRLMNHIHFADMSTTSKAVRAAQEKMFTREEYNALLLKDDVPEQLVMQEIMDAPGGVGIRRDLIEKSQSTIQEVLAKSKEDAFARTASEEAIKARYAKAFAPLEGITNEEEKRLATNIVRRQLGGMESPVYGDLVLQKLARLEVVTKLALGAIAQPSQMMSAVMRTGYKGSLKSLIKTVGNDPDALDFAIRSGVILKGLVRQSEQSLTGTSADFLERVYFTQFDMKSRVYGALQGRAYAEHMAQKFASKANRIDALVFGAGGQFRKLTSGEKSELAKLRKEMVRIEEKLQGVGIDTSTIVKRGGILSKKELLVAAQQVSNDVNFWGDSLSLPEFFRSPYGKYMTQFKSFGFQQSKLIKDHLIKPLMKGDWGPMVRFATLMPAGGEMIANLKGIARARNKRFEQLENPPADVVVVRMAENIANAAGFGLIWDAFEATRFGMAGGFGFIAGPIGTTGIKAYNAVGAAIRGNEKQALRFAIETGAPALTAIGAPAVLPFVAAAAPAASNILMPKRDQAE